MTCPACGSDVPGQAAACPACGHALGFEAREPSVLAGLRENVLAALAYFTFLPALAFIFLEPFKRSPFVRFHALQSLFLWVAAVVCAVILRLLLEVFLLLSGVLGLLLLAGSVILWAVLVLKAYQGEWFQLPLVGDLAERHARR